MRPNAVVEALHALSAIRLEVPASIADDLEYKVKRAFSVLAAAPVTPAGGEVWQVRWGDYWRDINEPDWWRELGFPVRALGVIAHPTEPAAPRGMEG